MTSIVRTFTASGIALLALATGVCADDAKASKLTLEVKAPQEVAVGDAIKFKLTLKNGGDDQSVREPMLDAKSFDFGVQFGDAKASRYTAYHPTSLQGSNLKSVDLKKGGTLEFEHEVIAVKVGAWVFTPRYHGAESGTVEGAPQAITVKEKDGGKQVLAEIKTSMGVMKVELWPEVAPATSLHIAGLVKRGYYDGLRFHRTIKEFMIQGGDPKGDGTGGPGYSIEAEFNDKNHSPGVFSMARNGDPMERSGAMPRPEFANTGGSQFFLVDGDASFLDKKYTAFGKVIDGIDVVHAIAAAPTRPGGEGSSPVNAIKMDSVTLIVAP